MTNHRQPKLSIRVACCTIETFRFYDDDDYEYEIFSIPRENMRSSFC